MNSKEGQSALEIMLMESLVAKLVGLGANKAHAEQIVENLDFNDVRAHLTRTDEDLKEKLANAF